MFVSLFLSPFLFASPLSCFQSLSYADIPNYDFLRQSLDKILYSSTDSTLSVFPTPEMIWKHDLHLHLRQASPSPSPSISPSPSRSLSISSSYNTPDWMFSHPVNQLDVHTIQEILRIRCENLLSHSHSDTTATETTTTATSISFTMASQIWISLVKTLLQLPEPEVEWRTIQSLDSILKRFQWFYSSPNSATDFYTLQQVQPQSLSLPSPLCLTLSLFLSLFSCSCS